MRFKITNPLYKTLIKNKLIKYKNLEIFFNRTRDKKMKVFRDIKSKIIFLEKYLTKGNFYKNIEYLDKINKYKKLSIIKTKKNKYVSLMINDDVRRAKQFKNYFQNKNILDFGCGWGGMLNNIKNSKSLNAVELRKNCVRFIQDNFKDIKIQENILDFKKKFDVITLFHVLEHIPNQIETLKIIKKKLSRNGKIIIEVPHAEDFLLEFKDLPEFKKFTLWSEHLILHTTKSLEKFLEEAGYKNIKIYYFQRYGFDNHLGWFLKKKPGGHDFFKNFSTNKFNEKYSNFLIDQKKSDTLIAIAS